MKKIRHIRLIIIFILMSGIFLSLQQGTSVAINNISSNQHMYLTIVANRPFIQNRNTYAEEILFMCQNNGFETLKFTRTIEEFTYIEVSVYLWRWQIGKTDPNFIIVYDTDKVNKKTRYDITIK